MTDSNSKQTGKSRENPNTQTSPLQRTAIIRAIQRREHAGNRLGIRMRLNGWSLTVGLTKGIKRTFDIFVTLIAIFLLSPLMVCVMILIRLESPGAVVFRQIRVGKDGRHFSFYKFRSMYQDAEARKQRLMSQNESADGVIFKMKDDPRITRVGKFIRKTSIDELPQLFNVLFGDMSLVGPRPPLPSEVAKYSLEERKRLNVIPGITCIWQVSGRSDIPFKEQVRLDQQYIRSQSPWTDIKILLKTIPAILSGRGAY